MIRGGEVIDKKGCTSELTGIDYDSETPIQLSRGEIREGQSVEKLNAVDIEIYIHCSLLCIESELRGYHASLQKMFRCMV